jgi:hypothetical protein
MSVELVRRATLLTSGDGQVTDAELAEIFAPGVVLDLTARVFNPKVYEGYEGLREFYAESREVWEHVDLRVREIIEEGERYLVIADARSRGRGSGLEVDAEAVGIWTLADGRLARYRLLDPMRVDRDDALAALRDQSGM